MEDSLSKSVYIHIPFCDSICSYCDFAKFLKSTNYVKQYLVSLEKEIKNNYQGDLINTIYVGGGTPTCLNLEELEQLLKIIEVFKTENLEYTFEGNIENICEEKIKLLAKYGVNRISIGIQTFNEKHLAFLNRKHKKDEVFAKINMIKKYIKNINVDLMYAFKDQTLEELKEDLKLFKQLDVPHISTYSLIIEKNTVLYNQNIKNIDPDLDYEMYELIKKELANYHHYEISNFALKGYESRHNLVYWNNLEYYGFGLGASGYLNSVRYTNTRSINKYFKGDYLFESHKLDKDEKIENELILGFRKTSGINVCDFKIKYGIDIFDVKNINKLLKEEKLILKDNNIFINPKYLYVSNDILVLFI